MLEIFFGYVPLPMERQLVKLWHGCSESMLKWPSHFHVDMSRGAPHLGILYCLQLGNMAIYVWLKLICDRTREQFCSFQRQRKFINCSANSCLPEVLENWKPWSI